MRRLLGTFLVVTIVWGGAGACSSDDGANEGAGASSPAATTTPESTGARGTLVTIENFAYSPPLLRADVGQEITVKNADGVAHTLTAEDRSFSTGTLDPSGSATVKPARPGTFSYFCEIHQYMKGQLTVS